MKYIMLNDGHTLQNASRGNTELPSSFNPPNSPLITSGDLEILEALTLASDQDLLQWPQGVDGMTLDEMFLGI